MILSRPRTSLFPALVTALGLLTSLNAGALELKTDDREVYGTREVESGNYTAGIDKLETALARSVTQRDRAPVLNNLCVAAVASGDLEAAANWCEAAVENGYNLDLAYNNRGVMHYAAGNVAQARDDIEMADRLGLGVGVASRNLAQLDR